jgi:pimeloyl-ACP methyl ester carboxylesterase
MVMNERLEPLPSRRPLPLILIRGFGGLGVEDEKRIAYQGFNDGTVYPRKRGENFIYEGLILRLMKSNWRYQDATNVIGYYGSPVVEEPSDLPLEVKDFDPSFFGVPQGATAEEKARSIYKVVVDPAMAASLLRNTEDVAKTLWVFRYYDLDDRSFATYGDTLVRLIDFIRELAKKKDQPVPKVNIIAHSMGGLLVREAIQRSYPASGRHARTHINKVVTLGTPHQGIAFQWLREWIKIDASEEIEHFNPDFQKDPTNASSFLKFEEHFSLKQLLTVVGTNYRTYGSLPSLANRLASIGGEFGLNYNRSDGLVKQTNAQIPGAPRTFVDKCHGGYDSLVTSREAFEVATRFFFGDLRARLRLLKAKITRGGDWFGKSEYFFGVSIKPRRVDFDLFHQSAEAENCYGPFRKDDLCDAKSEKVFWWADDNRLIWEGHLDSSKSERDDMIFRLDFYVGERDLHGVGFSDNVIFRKQYYVQAILPPRLLTEEGEGSKDVALVLHTDERFAREKKPPGGQPMQATAEGWEFEISGTGFKATLGIELDAIPEVGSPVPLAKRAARPAGSA